VDDDLVTRAEGGALPGIAAYSPVAWLYAMLVAVAAGIAGLRLGLSVPSASSRVVPLLGGMDGLQHLQRSLPPSAGTGLRVLLAFLVFALYVFARSALVQVTADIERSSSPRFARAARASLRTLPRAAVLAAGLLAMLYAVNRMLAATGGRLAPSDSWLSVAGAVVLFGMLTMLEPVATRAVVLGRRGVFAATGAAFVDAWRHPGKLLGVWLTVALAAGIAQLVISVVGSFAGGAVPTGLLATRIELPGTAFTVQAFVGALAFVPVRVYMAAAWTAHYLGVTAEVPIADALPTSPVETAS
jgi:hypothetical protein